MESSGNSSNSLNSLNSLLYYAVGTSLGRKAIWIGGLYLAAAPLIATVGVVPVVITTIIVMNT